MPQTTRVIAKGMPLRTTGMMTCTDFEISPSAGMICHVVLNKLLKCWCSEVEGTLRYASACKTVSKYLYQSVTPVCLLFAVGEESIEPFFFKSRNGKLEKNQVVVPFPLSSQSLFVH